MTGGIRGLHYNRVTFIEEEKMKSTVVPIIYFVQSCKKILSEKHFPAGKSLSAVESFPEEVLIKTKNNTWEYSIFT